VKKAIHLLVAMMLIITMFVMAACGAEEAEEPAEETVAEETAAEEPAAEEPAEGEVVTLAYWSMWNEPEVIAQTIQAWIDDFEAQNPNIRIEPVWNGRENQTKARTALAGGTVIDIVDQDADQIAGGMMVEGLGYPLNEFLDQKALDEDIPIRDVFYPGVLGTFEMDGKIYLWPYMNSVVMWWYNKDIFEEAGVSVPETWDELLDIGVKIKDAGYGGMAVEGDVFDYNMFIYNYYLARLKGKGFLLSAIEDKTGESWNDPAIVGAMAEMQKLWDLGIIPPESEGYVWPAGQTTLALGETAMEICGAWLPNELATTAGPDFNWGGFRFPAVKGGVGDIDDLQNWLLAAMIMKDSKHPAEAFEFLKFMMTKKNQQMMADDALQGVTRVGVEWPVQIADGAAASASAKDGLLHVDGGTAYYAEFVTTVLNQPFLDAFYKRITPEEFGSLMAEKAAAYWANK
jgi:raffinose/stachyose/melibiose transport system substrate-binding protein